MAAQSKNDLPIEQWGPIRALTPVESRRESTASNDPTKINLRQPFVVCVLGASRGVGAGIACAYAKPGASGITLASRRISSLDETAARCRQNSSSVDIETVSRDITSAQSVASFADIIKPHFGHLDVTVLNSGHAD